MDKFYIAKLVKFHRKKCGWSLKSLADYAGVGKTVVFDIEHGKQTVGLGTLLKILNALNIHIVFESPLMREFMEIDRE